MPAQLGPSGQACRETKILGPTHLPKAWKGYASPTFPTRTCAAQERADRHPPATCIQWWEQVLALRMTQRAPTQAHGDVVELFTDARGSPPRLAAVLFADGETTYTDLATPPELLALFKPREDAQIMGQEFLAIALGLCTFLPKLRNRCVRVWCDNRGGECCLRSGSARAGDHNLMIHAIWLLSARENFGLWIEGAP